MGPHITACIIIIPSSFLSQRVKKSNKWKYIRQTKAAHRLRNKENSLKIKHITQNNYI